MQKFETESFPRYLRVKQSETKQLRVTAHKMLALLSWVEEEWREKSF